ncbi:hypothetical protein ACFLUC_02820 [Chloroflexota bacterium]
MTGRPASGKSEIIDFLVNLPEDDRLQRFHIAKMDIIDDFPMVWTWFEEDDILRNELDKQGLHTDEQGYFTHNYLWDLLIHRINLEYQKHLRDDPNYHTHSTSIIEFSRGSEHGGYQQAFNHLSESVLSSAGIFYVSVSFEESKRKNRLRFNPERPDSILEHSLPDEKLTRMYHSDDWTELCANSSDFLRAGKTNVPYVTFENGDDVTSGPPDQLASRLESRLNRLWKLREI